MNNKERIETMLYTQKIALLSKIIWKNAENDWQYWLKKSGITINEYMILITVYAYERITITDISKQGVMHVSTAFNFAKRLEQQNLLVLEKDVYDKRNTFLKLTHDGKEFVEQTLNHYDEEYNSIYKASKAFEKEMFHLPHFNDMHYLVSKLHGRHFIDELHICHEQIKNKLLDDI
ncbi:HTH-type transcriptional regulator Hpr [Staphylococcus felis]|uniref:HTH-type transcriptional regulator Hpr n=1 Tax=Staphylococcus felis TaxID=46127 RepID=UPI000E24C13F|nr:HTH-type transcriptional regulator Hpr [Staphylococcus felis]REH86920.1 HTH-type transcriptional regulator Hpr [Staphylococcus felis]REH93000.1 HTH-type transcriptional regulator Hpr [Staphylococcus felis]